MLVLNQVCLIAVLLVYQVAALANLEEVFAWKDLSFVWPNEDVKSNAIKSGNYVPGNSLPLGIHPWKNKMFLTFPRWKKGVPFTLGYVPLDQPINKSAAVIPYPDYKTNTLPEKNGTNDGEHFVSVIRVAIDVCDRLWFVDTNLAHILGEGGLSWERDVYSGSILYIYDLNTDKLLKKYILNEKVTRPDSFIANIVLDVNKDRCDDAFAYIPDLATFAVVVYSLKDNDSWRFKHHFFHIDPLQGDFNVGGINFQWIDGIFGMALGPEDQDGFRTVYFHPSASLNEFAVNSAILKNKTLAGNPHIYHEFKLLGNRGEKSQSTAEVLDEKTNVLFLTQLNRDGVACWNTKNDLKPENVPLIATDAEKLIFTNDIRLDQDRYLWMISNKMPQFMYRSLNPNETNFRIYKVKVDDAIAGTPCVA